MDAHNESVAIILRVIHAGLQAYKAGQFASYFASPLRCRACGPTCNDLKTIKAIQMGLLGMSDPHLSLLHEISQCSTSIVFPVTRSRMVS
jgi:hypothetical protein